MSLLVGLYEFIQSLCQSGTMKKFIAGFVSITASIAVTAGLLVGGPASPAAANSVPTRFMSGWMPYWTTNASVNSFLANSSIFSDISPFWHNAAKSSSTSSRITIQNHLSKSERDSVLSKIKGKGAGVWPSITDGTGAGYMSSVMKNSTRRAALVNQIHKLVVDNKYDGIDLDFEKFAFSDSQSTWASTRPAWVQFMKQLSAKFKASGKKISVALPPMRGDRNGYWVYDWKGIRNYIDKLRVMTYDYAWSTPGPVGGPLSWVEEVTKYGVSAVGGRKFQVGTPTYGRDWAVSGSGCGSTKTFHSNQRVSLYGSSGWKRDPASRELYKNYTTGKCKRSAWVSDASTAVARLAIAKKYNTGGLAQWMVGTEVSSQWSKLRALAGIRGQKVSRSYSNKLRRPGTKLWVRGKISPKRKANIRLQRYTKKGWRNVRTVKTTKAGNYRTSMYTKKRKARYTFRMYAPARSGYTAAYSRTITLRTR